jgi:DNA-binding transcriptional MerR regulator
MLQSKATANTLTIPAKLYRVGELVRYTPFSRQTIHNYTTMGLIREAQWTDGGHRLYDESVFERLGRIIELRKTRTLSQIRRILNQEDAGTTAANRSRNFRLHEDA